MKEHGYRMMTTRLFQPRVKGGVVAALLLFVAGIVFWGGFNTAMEATNTLGFCISCHEMESTVYQEYRASSHHTNPSGVQAVCSDCHVPREWVPISRLHPMRQTQVGPRTGAWNWR